jgi:MFS family permease
MCHAAQHGGAWSGVNRRWNATRRPAARSPNMQAPPPTAPFETDVPARLDRLPWARFHTLVVAALGITWILDGLEVTLVGALGPAIAASPTLGMDAATVGYAASAYLAGAVLGALLFGWLADRWGRKKLFIITLLVYVGATMATGLAWDPWSFALFRFLTGAGIGGEYSAINSAIQELIPARHRGHTDLAINGSFWVGAAIGALASLVLLNQALFPGDWGWRLAFLVGGAIALVVLPLRRFLPESPRWLMTHGHADRAEQVVQGIEARVGVRPGSTDAELWRIRIRPRASTSLADVVRTLFATYPRRSCVIVTMMTAQAFCYNAIFFTYALVLTRFHGVANESVGLFLLPFAAGNFLGPLLLGRLFDTIGRRVMIGATYAISAALLTATGWAFNAGLLDAWGQTFAWTVLFFFASAAASSAYLTAGESFPLEIRALAIAVFYAFGTGLGGIAGPAVFGALIEGGSRFGIFLGYLLGAALMAIAAFVAWRFGVDAERRSLEHVAVPLSGA